MQMNAYANTISSRPFLLWHQNPSLIKYVRLMKQLCSNGINSLIIKLCFNAILREFKDAVAVVSIEL